MKRALAATAGHLEKERRRSKEMLQEIHDKNNRIEQLVLGLQSLRKKSNDLMNRSISSEERAKQLEAIIDDEQRNYNIFLQDINKMQGVLFRNQQALVDLQTTGKTKEMEITNLRASAIILKKEIKKTYNDLEIQRGLSYNVVSKEFCKRNEKSTLFLQGIPNKSTGSQVAVDRRRKQRRRSRVFDSTRQRAAKNLFGTSGSTFSGVQLMS